MNDLDIARQFTPRPIKEIAAKIGLSEEHLEPYGHYKAKLPLTLIDKEKAANSNLILVSAISPTPAGEGKTTTSIGLTDGLNRIGKKAMAVLREPSLGPVFGIKGGATGGGYAQVLPMEDINLHFTGDFAAIEKANNLLSALIDNNLHQRKVTLDIDPRTVSWKRVMDMNDRALRNIIVGLGGKTQGVPREGGFNITAASEVMAILCMCDDPADLKRRLGNIFVGYTYDRKPIYARDLQAEGAMAALLKDAIKPNLVQTLEQNPVILHGGPFANIAQGTNTILGTRMGLTLADYVVTEAGFGFDLGGEKFLDIKCRAAGLKPKAIVLVATIRALKYHGGVSLKELTTENVEALKKGVVNLEKHLENAAQFGIPAVVSINRFTSDTDAEVAAVQEACEKIGVKAFASTVWADGGAGAEALAQEVVNIVDSGKADFKPLYELDGTVEEKIKTIATRIYGAEDVEFAPTAKLHLRRINNLGLNHLPICMAKTQKSLSDNDKLLGRPTGFTITIREIEIAAGAEFLVPITGSIMRMPGLPSVPAANGMSIDDDGLISGLF